MNYHGNIVGQIHVWMELFVYVKISYMLVYVVYLL